MLSEQEKNLLLKYPADPNKNKILKSLESVACEQAPRLGKTKRNWSWREGKTAESVISNQQINESPYLATTATF